MEIKASEKFKWMLGFAADATREILQDLELDDARRKYYGVVFECLQNLKILIRFGYDGNELKTEDEMIAEMKKENKDLMENPETVAKFLIELKDEYAGYPVSICDMDGNEEMHFLLLQETDFDYLASIGYKKVLDSKIFACKIYDDDGDEEIYIEIEE